MQRRETASLTAAAALALSFAPTLMRRRRREQLAVSVASAALGGLAGAATEILVMRLAERLEGGEAAARATLAGAGALSVLAELPANPHPGVSLAGQAARVSGICALLGAVTPAREAVPLDRPRTLVAVGAAGVAALVGWQQLDKRSRPRRPRLTEYPAERRLATTAGVAADFEGSRFTGTATPADAIGPDAQDPIRVFVGLHAAPDVESAPARRRRAGAAGRVRAPPHPQHRARIAVDELERLGAFGRRRILVCSPTLRGYVNPVPVAAEEHLSGGDVASVVVQYHDKRTLLMPAKVPIAARTHRALLEELRRRVPHDGPEVCVYGESLGAWASQNVFRGERRARARRGPRQPRAVDRDAVLLAPAAAPGQGRDPVRRARRHGPHEGAAGRRGRPRLALRVPRAPHRSRRAVQRPGPDLAPPGVAPARPLDAGRDVRALAFDLVAATNWTASVPQALAHDYRLEGPLAVDLALGHHAARERVGELADRLVAEEAARGARLRALRRGDGYTQSH